jgi:DNA-damage-inducible protein D
MSHKAETSPEFSAKIAIFKGREIRKALISNEWWFSVVDVIGALTDSGNPRDYWFKMKDREKENAEVELSTICRQLKLPAPDGSGFGNQLQANA